VRTVKKHSGETLLVLGVFSLFAILAVLLTLMGAKVYRGISERMDANNSLRSSLSYVANKVRGGDMAGSISLEEREGMQVLCLSEETGGTTFETLLFFSDGWLREYAAVSGAELYPDSGEPIVELSEFQMSREGDLLQFWAQTKSGQKMDLQIAVRSEEDAAS
jgi:hypothetical protein